MKGKVLLGVVGGICVGFLVGKYKEKTGERVVEVAKESLKKVKETCENIFVGKDLVDVEQDINDTEDQLRDAIKNNDEDKIADLQNAILGLEEKKDEYNLKQLKRNLILYCGVGCVVGCGIAFSYLYRRI